MIKEASERKFIRFIDSDYNDLFFLPDGANIRLTYANGEERILSCKYMDEYHLKAGSEVFHICQFAELMERNGTQYRPETPLPLPERCHALHPETGELIVLQCDKRGYTVSPFSQRDAERNQRLADQENSAIHVGRVQVSQLLDKAFHRDIRKPARKHNSAPER